MVLTAVRGALGFLTRLPVGRTTAAWEALGDWPPAMVVVAYVVGALLALPLVLPIPAVTVALAFVVTVVAVTGITHVDGLADVGDAAVVHGTVERRRAVMTDADLGVGGTVAVGLDLLGLALAGGALTGLPTRSAVAVVVASEVGAKLAMVVLATVGRPAHDGMGATLLGARPGSLLVALLVAAPAAVLGWPSLAPLAALVAAIATGVVVLAWAHARLAGVSGDVFGATNELARLAALHVGVVAWTLS